MQGIHEKAEEWHEEEVVKEKNCYEFKVTPIPLFLLPFGRLEEEVEKWETKQ